MSQGSLQVVFIKAEGAEQVAAAMGLVGGLLGTTAVHVKTTPELSAAIEQESAREENRPTFGRIADNRLIKARKRRAAAPAGEPDGFRLPDPAPSTPIGVFDRPAKTKANMPFGLGGKIFTMLDNLGGCAAFEAVRKRFHDHSTQAINMAITKCTQLKRLDDGRIALEGYEDEE